MGLKDIYPTIKVYFNREGSPYKVELIERNKEPTDLGLNIIAIGNYVKANEVPVVKIEFDAYMEYIYDES